MLGDSMELTRRNTAKYLLIIEVLNVLMSFHYKLKSENLHEYFDM